MKRSGPWRHLLALPPSLLHPLLHMAQELHFSPAWCSQALTQCCCRRATLQSYLWTLLLLLPDGSWLGVLGAANGPHYQPWICHCIHPIGTESSRRAWTTLGPSQLPSPNGSQAHRFYGVFHELPFPTSRKNSKCSAEVESQMLDLVSKTGKDNKDFLPNTAALFIHSFIRLLIYLFPSLCLFFFFLV